MFALVANHPPSPLPPPKKRRSKKHLNCTFASTFTPSYLDLFISNLSRSFDGEKEHREAVREAGGEQRRPHTFRPECSRRAGPVPGPVEGYDAAEEPSGRDGRTCRLAALAAHQLERRGEGQVSQRGQSVHATSSCFSGENTCALFLKCISVLQMSQLLLLALKMQKDSG